MIGRAALLALLLLGIALAHCAGQAVRALDAQYTETRYVVERRWCPLAEVRAGEFWEWCPAGSGQGET